MLYKEKEKKKMSIMTFSFSFAIPTRARTTQLHLKSNSNVRIYQQIDFFINQSNILQDLATSKKHILSKKK